MGQNWARHLISRHTAATEIYTLSLHDALPICLVVREGDPAQTLRRQDVIHSLTHQRSEEHTSELQSRLHLVCRLLLEKKKSARKMPRLGRNPMITAHKSPATPRALTRASTGTI